MEKGAKRGAYILMYSYSARVFNIVDGDTIDCELDLGFHLMTKLRFRLLGIDTPEVVGADKVKGLEAKNWLYKKIAHRS